MARSSYIDKNTGLPKNIHSMTTRELRGYIADQAEEAQERLSSIDLDDASKAFRDAASDITYKNGRVIRSTSNMSKEEMREHAYLLRQFNSLDTESKFAESIDWQENKQRYQTFIRNKVEEGDEFWSQFLTPKGNVSKRGYKDYKDYISFLQSIEDVKAQYGYRTLKQYAEDARADTDPKERMRIISKLLNEVYTESRGKGWSQSRMIEIFEERLREYDEDQAKKKKKPVKPTFKKSSPKKSKSNVKIQKARKMREDGKVSERLT